jgi:RNA polymerase sigma-70 factor, ECF subfamily
MKTPDVDWSAFYADLHAFVSTRVRGAADTDDVVQLVLERALLKAPHAEIENVAAWLFGVARNAVTDYYREQARRSLAIAEALDLDEQTFEVAESERAAVLACMEPLLATLHSDDAQLLRWADMEGRAMQAIADDLRISLTAAKSRVQRARKEFVKTTQACCVVHQDPRGRVVGLTPHQKPLLAACECKSGAPRAPKGSS